MRSIFLAAGAALLTFSCSPEAQPKPKGELRLEYPAHSYRSFDPACPFRFEVSNSAVITNSPKNRCWFYIDYPKMKGRVFFTYYPVNGNLAAQIQESERMVYEHTVKASRIDVKSFEYPEKKVYGNFYQLQGYAASNVQFYATDSTRHFVNAYLYFNTRPNPDSLAPAVDYVRDDLMHLIDTFQWKN